MTRKELIEQFFILSEIEQRRKQNPDLPPSSFYKYLEEKGYLEENGIYHIPAVYYSMPDVIGRNHFWDKMDRSKYQSLFRMKKATRFAKEPFSYADFLCIRYVYSGTDEITTPDGSFVLAANDICLMNAGFVCSQHLSHDEDVVFTIMFEKDYLIKNVINTRASGSIITRFIYDYVLSVKSPQNYIIFHCRENDRLPRLIEDIVMEFTHPTEFGEILLESYLQILLVEMTHGEYEFEQNKKSIQTIRFAEILHEIDENYATITLNGLSKVFGYNPDYISRRIERMTGLTYKDYVLNKKMEHVCRLLQNSDLPIIEILEQCGFSSETYFYKKFKEKYHMTPRDYRLKT